jgi:hypothetical protein
MTISPQHGPLNCTKCFSLNQHATNANGWQLINDPGHWGAEDPVVLVLGQSKGNTQRSIFARGSSSFDRAGFAGSRPRLANILAKIGINISPKDVDSHFQASETNIAFASVLRCSISFPSGKTSGSPLNKAMHDHDAGIWLSTCMRTWLSKPYTRLRIVVLLGITQSYVDGIMDRIRDLHPSTFIRLDMGTAVAAGITWTFAQHPSPISENHYQKWISDAPHKKRDLARNHVLRALNSTN